MHVGWRVVYVARLPRVRGTVVTWSMDCRHVTDGQVRVQYRVQRNIYRSRFRLPRCIVFLARVGEFQTENIIFPMVPWCLTAEYVL